MTNEDIEAVVDRLKVALEADSPSARLQTAMAAGLRPNNAYIDSLVGLQGVVLHTVKLAATDGGMVELLHFRAPPASGDRKG